MKKIELTPIHLQSMHHAEFGKFVERFFEDFNKSGLNADTDADFSVLFEDLRSKIATYNKALVQIKESEATQKIAELDKMRANDFQALKDSIKPYRNSKKEERKASYKALKIALDEYKNVTNLSYEEETHKLKALISLLKEPEYKPHITALKLEEFLEELEESNTAFDTLFAERSAQNIGKETYDTKALRKEMTDLYRRMVNYIEALANVKKEEFYPKALEVINNSRKYYADVLAKRGGAIEVEKINN